VEGGLVAVVPVGSLRCVGVEMTLVDVGVRGLLVEPAADAVPALAQERETIFLKHFDDPGFFSLSERPIALGQPPLV
jgi:hypothetical protein